jgi:DMSO/TMAO reductase YedYZ heme-binding membrane subunit
VSVVLASGTPALWYLTRGTGAVTLILLTLSLVLGILEVERWAAGPSPRFAIAALHRSVSLLVLALLAVHILTAVLDSFAPIRLLDAVVPFTGVYRPVWLGLGALALDGLLAVTITSVVRRRLGLRAWRAVHWLAYACWPVAAVHGLGTGSDVKATWMLALTAVCAAALVAAIAMRLLGADPERLAVRAGAGATVVAVVLAAVLWVQSGPLGPGWARRAGTPAVLLAPRPAAAATRTIAAAPLSNGFSSRLQGSVRQGRSRGGRAVVDLRLHTAAARIRVRMSGRAATGGGLVMSRSAVTLGPPGDVARYRGRVTALGGTSVQATVGDGRGATLRLALALQLAGPRVGGTVVASALPGGGSG